MEAHSDTAIDCSRKVILTAKIWIQTTKLGDAKLTRVAQKMGPTVTEDGLRVRNVSRSFDRQFNLPTNHQQQLLVC